MCGCAVPVLKDGGRTSHKAGNEHSALISRAGTGIYKVAALFSTQIVILLTNQSCLTVSSCNYIPAAILFIILSLSLSLSLYRHSPLRSRLRFYSVPAPSWEQLCSVQRRKNHPSVTEQAGQGQEAAMYGTIWVLEQGQMGFIFCNATVEFLFNPQSFHFPLQPNGP